VGVEQLFSQMGLNISHKLGVNAVDISIHFSDNYCRSRVPGNPQGVSAARKKS